jgi:hypothetical protein
MGDEKQPPLEFANQVISMFASNILGETDLTDANYSTIRVTFRKLGGSWFELCHGNIDQLGLLVETIKAWKNLQGRKSTSNPSAYGSSHAPAR